MPPSADTEWLRMAWSFDSRAIFRRPLETGGGAATVLSDFAAESDSIEIARVEAAKARAETLLAEKKERGDLAMVERDLQRAILQLKVAQKIRTRRRQ